MLSDGAPDTIRDLLHDQTERRREALVQLSQNWDIKFREYLWKAIEDEFTRSNSNKDIQKKMVELAVNKLEERSLRKMIRFMEKGCLYPSSTTAVLEAYIRYENKEIRSALLKSLRRDKSQIPSFVIRLLGSDHLIELGEKRLYSLCLDVLGPTIPTKSRKKFVTRLMERYYRGGSIRSVLETIDIWSIIQKDEVLACEVLEFFFFDDKKEPRLLWQVGQWKEVTTELHTNPVVNLVTSSEKNLLRLTSSPYRSVRNLCIRILWEQQRKFSPTVLPFWSERDETWNTYWENLFLIWEKMLENQLVDDFLFLPNFQPQTLDQFFSLHPTILIEMKALNINPVELSTLMLAYLPRYYLYRLMRNDPDAQNRELCYSSLRCRSMWMDIDNNEIIGPSLEWVNVLLQCIRGLRFETHIEIHRVATLLLLFLIDLLKTTDSPLKNRIQAMLDERVDFSKMDDPDRIFPLKYRLSLFLRDIPLPYPPSLDLPGPLSRIFIKELVGDLTVTIDVETIKRMAFSLEADDRLFLLEHLLERVQSRNYLSREEVSQLADFLNALREDSDVRIRTKSYLLYQRLFGHPKDQ